MKWLILGLGIACNAVASLLLKHAVERPPGIRLSAPMSLLTNWPLLVGVGAYAGAFLLYAMALTRFPINVAHPILTCGAIAVVAAGAGTVYGETFRWTTVVGICLVCCGVVLISLKSA